VWKIVICPIMGIMKEKELRFRVPLDLYKRYKILCIDMELSITKQSVALIENFIKIQEDNLKTAKHLKKMMKQ